KLGDIDLDYCPDDDSVQYPIGGQIPIEQLSIIELHDQVNITAIEIVVNRPNDDIKNINNHDDNDIVLLGDDRSSLYMFQKSKSTIIQKREILSNYSQSVILSMKFMNKTTGELLILTNNEMIKENLFECDKHQTCNECSMANNFNCHWCSEQNRCTSIFQCPSSVNHHNNEFNMCMNIEHVTPNTITLNKSSSWIDITLSSSLELLFRNDLYLCQFTNEKNINQLLTTAVLLKNNALYCPTPLSYSFNGHTSDNKPLHKVQLSIYHNKTKSTFGSYQLTFYNCSAFLTCSSCTNNVKSSSLCSWCITTGTCIDSSSICQNELKRTKISISNQEDCPIMYFTQQYRIPFDNFETSIDIQIEQCNNNNSIINLQKINYCMLRDFRKRSSLITKQYKLIQVETNGDDLCLLTCRFKSTDYHQQQQQQHMLARKPLNLELSLYLANNSLLIPKYYSTSQIQMYKCEKMAYNCSLCLNLHASYNCVWCKNGCHLSGTVCDKTVTRQQLCIPPQIETIKPINYPTNGGTLVTITGKYLTTITNDSPIDIQLAGIKCELIREESTSHKLICRTGDAEQNISGPIKVTIDDQHSISDQQVSYLMPIIESIEPLAGILSGGTILTIIGRNFTLGNQFVIITIGESLCKILDIKINIIQCQTLSFERTGNKSITITFDEQTHIVYHQQFFHVVHNPTIDLDNLVPQQSFASGGRRIHITGTNFHFLQQIKMEFSLEKGKSIVYVSSVQYLSNSTYLVFLTPSYNDFNLTRSELNPLLNVNIKLYIDGYNFTHPSFFLHYVNDPIIYEFEPPLIRPYSSELVIYGNNMTLIGHTMNDVFVHIGCEICPIIYFSSDKIICRPPISRPAKRSTSKNTERLCYDSEQPWIIVSIDNIHSLVGYLLYPRKIIILGVVSGCLLTILIVVIIILIFICLKMRYEQHKHQCIYNDNSNKKNKKSYIEYRKGGTNLIYQQVPLKQSNVIEPIYSQTMSPIVSLLPIRSYISYLQTYFVRKHQLLNKPYFSSSYDTPKHLIYSPTDDLIENFQLFLKNEQFLLSILHILSDDDIGDKLLSIIVLTQSENIQQFLKIILTFENEKKRHNLYYDIYALISYDYLKSYVANIYYQLYTILKSKMNSGPCDSIENLSYYTLNDRTLLKDTTIPFKHVQLCVHIELTDDKSYDFIRIQCITCDTITQVKQKLIDEIFQCLPYSKRPNYNNFDLILLTTKLTTNTSSCSSSSSCSSTNSSLPLTRKATNVTKNFWFSRTITIPPKNDQHHHHHHHQQQQQHQQQQEFIVLNDIDNTSETSGHMKKLNTLQHYGIVQDGYELKFQLIKNNDHTLSKYDKHDTRMLKNEFIDTKIPSPLITRTIKSLTNNHQSPNITANRLSSPCRYCSHTLSLNNEKKEFSFNSFSLTSTSTEQENTRLFHLSNHTYEEIHDSRDLMLRNSDTCRLYETKLLINVHLLTLIENIFVNSDEFILKYFIGDESFIYEFFHLFYAHFIPFIIHSLNCLLDLQPNPCLESSFEIISILIQLGCYPTEGHFFCSLCENTSNDDTNMNIQNCTLLFTDEIERIRLLYTNSQRRLINKLRMKHSNPDYFTTNKMSNEHHFELDRSVLKELIQFSCSHVEQIVNGIQHTDLVFNFVTFVEMCRTKPSLSVNKVF
ncbi:unnamed protein product, partial [Didymodactylos carnosus]